MKKVVKFGGSSLASAEQFKKVGRIIRQDASRRYVVPSAPGKRYAGDIKVTDMLYSCYLMAIREEDEEESFDGLLAEIKARYDEIIQGLGLSLDLSGEFRTIRENFTPQDWPGLRGFQGRVPERHGDGGVPWI